MNCCADFSLPFGSDGDLQDAFVCVLLFYKSLLMDVAFSHEFQLLRVTLYSISHISKNFAPQDSHRNELMKNSYMHSDRVKQMEDIGVKVALGSALS